MSTQVRVPQVIVSFDNRCSRQGGLGLDVLLRFASRQNGGLASSSEEVQLARQLADGFAEHVGYC